MRNFELAFYGAVHLFQAGQNASVDMRIQIVRNGVPIFPKRNEKITSAHVDRLLDSEV